MNREGRQGLKLRLSITVLDTRTCLPIPNAVVDLWHCDGTGLYSHFIAASQGQMGAPTDASTFFRGNKTHLCFLLPSNIVSFNTGQQITDSQGVTVFDTIYPGWYQGRATHMHVKVHIGASLVSIGGIIHVIGGHVSHTGQFFFDDRMTDAVATFSPYSSHNILRTRNDQDMIYLQSNGVSTIVPITFPANTFDGGMAGEMTVGVDPTATPVDIGGGGLPPPPFGR